MKKIILVDGHNLLFRMFYGIPSSIKNSKGKEIRGLIGFIGSLKKLIEEFSPYSLVVIFDSETSKNSNLAIDANYKANRIDYTNVVDEENPFSQLPLIKKALDYLNIFYLEVENNEADDYIASVACNSNNNSYQFIIVSTDSDFIQLVNSNIYFYVSRGKKSVLYDEIEVMKKYYVTSSKYIIFKALVGDKSDNIKGIAGIGKVMAAKILQYDSIEDFIVHNQNSRFSNILLNNKDMIKRNIGLIKLNRELDTSSVIIEKLSNKIMYYKTYEIIENIGER